MIHIVRTHKGGGERSSQVRTIAYNGVWDSRLCTYAKNFLEPQNLNIFLFLYKRSYYIAIYYCAKKSVNQALAINRNHSIAKKEKKKEFLGVTCFQDKTGNRVGWFAVVWCGDNHGQARKVRKTPENFYRSPSVLDKVRSG